MRKKLTMLAMILVLCLLTAAGCGKANKVTVNQIIEEVNKNTADLDSMEMKMIMEMNGDVTFSEGGLSITADLGMKMDVDMQMTTKPEAVYMNADMTAYVRAELLGEEMEELMDDSMEYYMVIEDGNAVSYSKDGGSVWYYEEVTEIDTMSNAYDISELADIGVEFVLQDKTSKYNDKDVYVVTSTITGEILKDVYTNISVDSDTMNIESDMMENLNAEITYYVYKDDMMPAKFIMDFGDSGVLPIEDMGELNFSTFYLEMDIISINEVKEIVVPDDVKSQAVGNVNKGAGETEAETDDGDDDDDVEINADGAYVLRTDDGKAAMHVLVPADFEYISPYSDSLFISSDDVDVYYNIDNYWNEEEYYESFMEDEYERAVRNDDYADPQLGEMQKITVNGKEVKFQKLTYLYAEKYECVNYLAWIYEDGVGYSAEIEIFDNSDAMIDDSIVEVIMSTISIDGEVTPVVANTQTDNNGDAADIAGIWDITAMSIDGEEQDLDLLKDLGLDMYMEFAVGGKVELVLMAETMQGTYSMNGDKIDITFDGETQTAVISGNKMTIEVDEDIMIMEKRN